VSHEEKSQQGLSSTNKTSFTIKIPRHNTNTSIDDILVEGESVEVRDSFNGENITLFTGVVEDIEVTHSDLKHEYQVTVYDAFYEGIKREFEEDQILLDKFICNSTDKANSLVHQFAYKMGLSDSSLKVFEVTNQNEEYITIPFIRIKLSKQVLFQPHEIQYFIKIFLCYFIISFSHLYHLIHYLPFLEILQPFFSIQAF